MADEKGWSNGEPAMQGMFGVNIQVEDFSFIYFSCINLFF